MVAVCAGHGVGSLGEDRQVEQLARGEGNVLGWSHERALQVESRQTVSDPKPKDEASRNKAWTQFQQSSYIANCDCL